MIKKYSIYISLLLLLMALPAAAKLKVVTTSKDLASIARSIGDTRTDVSSLSSGTSDLHYLQARPDFIMRLNRADVFIQVGLDLEIGWVPLLLRQARNRKIQPGAPGYCMTWRGIPVREKPTGVITRQMGDMHPRGNPHYWTDPVNGILIGRNIRDTLIRVDPAGAAYYRKNFSKFRQEVTALTRQLLALMKPLRGRSVAVYHTEFLYLLERFGLKSGAMIEELPGVSPSPAHLRRVAKKIKREKIPLILASPWSNLSYARRVARQSGARLVILPIQTGSSSGTGTYQAMLKKCVSLIQGGLR